MRKHFEAKLCLAMIAPATFLFAANVSAQLPKLTGQGDHIPNVGPSTIWPPGISPTQVADMAGTTFSGTWDNTVQSPWVGTFNATGLIPGSANSGFVDYDFTSLPLGYLPKGTFFLFGDVDGGTGLCEKFELEAFDGLGNSISVEWLTEPLVVNNSTTPLDMPGWDWNITNPNQYRIDGTTEAAPGNPSVGFALVTCEDISRLTLDKLATNYGFVIQAPPAECAFESNNILCELDATGQPTGDFAITGTFTNLQDIPGTHLFLFPGATPAGVDVCFGNGQQGMQIDPPLNNGDSYEVGSDLSNSNAIIVKNAMPGDEVCFTMTLLGENGVECCTLEACFEMPPCDCLQVDRRFDQISEIVCNADGTINFSYSFQLTNLFGMDVYHSFLGSLGDELFLPDYFDLFAANGNAPLAQGQSVQLKTVVTGALPGDLVDFLITVHNEDLSECCTRPHDVMAPECDDAGGQGVVLLGDMNFDGVVDLIDIGPFVQLISSGNFMANGDINEDGAIDLNDIAPFVELLTGNP